METRKVQCIVALSLTKGWVNEFKISLEHLATLWHDSTTPPAALQAFASVVPAPPILHEVPGICFVLIRVVYCSQGGIQLFRLIFAA
jgi:hypothetical protein